MVGITVEQKYDIASKKIESAIDYGEESIAGGFSLVRADVLRDRLFDFGYQEHEEEITECDFWDFFFCEGGYRDQVGIDTFSDLTKEIDKHDGLWREIEKDEPVEPKCNIGVLKLGYYLKMPDGTEHRVGNMDISEMVKEAVVKAIEKLKENMEKTDGNK